MQYVIVSTAPRPVASRSMRWLSQPQFIGDGSRYGTISANFPRLLIYHETPIYYQNQPPTSYGIRQADPIPRPIAPALNALNFANPAAITSLLNANTPAAYAVHPTAAPHAAGNVLNRPAGFDLPPTGLQPIPPTTTTTAYTYANEGCGAYTYTDVEE
jgi:hypothetical protein